jgi:hypothetical protein
MNRLQQVQKFLKEQLEPRWAERLSTPQKGESIEDFVKRQKEFRDFATTQFDVGLKHTKVAPIDLAVMSAFPSPVDELLYYGGGEMAGELFDDKVKRMRDDSMASDIAARSKASRQDMDKRTRRDPSLGSFDPLANTREDMVDLAKQIDRRKAEEEADKKERIRKETEQLLGPRNLGTSNIGFKFTVESFAPKSLKRLQQVQKFLAEYNQELFDFIDMPPHQLHGKQAEQMANDFIKNTVNKPAVVQNDHIHSERPSIQTLVTRLKGLRNRISGISNELPTSKPQGSPKLSPEEMDQLKQKWNKLSQSRTDQTPSLFLNPEISASNLIKPKENREYYTAISNRRM